MQVAYSKAIGDALKEEMRRDDKVLMIGEDIGEFGNIFGITRGMLEEFGPKRVRNTPIIENAIVSCGVGAAITGLRPCFELMYSDFTMCAFTEIFHLMAKWRYVHGPKFQVPLVIRCASGAANGAGAELAAKFQEDLYYELDCPVCRIAALDVPMPYNLAMERYSIPTVERIMDSVRGMFA